VEIERTARPDLDSLVAIFSEQPDRLALFEPVSPEEMPEPYRGLLAHDQHMTVTVEAFHQTPVDVDVLQVAHDHGRYCRQILLRRQSDGGVVQFGIVRIDLNPLSPQARAQIEARRTPLGRVLIQNQVLREVESHQMYQVECREDLAKLFDVPPGTLTYGRTALIYFDAKPAVELLEIVTPVERGAGS
jgi:chorismate-pyruvate lyase